MTTYKKILDVIVVRLGELDMGNRKLAKIVAVDYQAMCNYLSGRVRMPVDVMFACLSALGIKFNFEVQEAINENRIV